MLYRNEELEEWRIMGFDKPEFVGMIKIYFLI